MQQDQGISRGPCSITKPAAAAKAKQVSGGGIVVCVEGTGGVSGLPITAAYGKVYPANAPVPDEPPSGVSQLSVTSGGFHTPEIGVPGTSGEFQMVVWVLIKTGTTSNGTPVYLLQRCIKTFTIGSVGNVTDCSAKVPVGECGPLDAQIRWLCRALCEKELEIQRLKELCGEHGN